MAPASVAGASIRSSTSVADAGRVSWDRDSIIEAIREWVAAYDEPPRAADLNPSSAKWSGQTWRVERYRAGRADGSPWPSLNAAKRPFGGSLAAAVRAAGFEPSRPGPRRRDVVPAQADRLQMPPDVRVLLDAALATARDADRRSDVLTGRLDRATARVCTLVGERDAARRRSAGADARARASVEAELRGTRAELERVRENAAVAASAAADLHGRAAELGRHLVATERSAAASRAEGDALRGRLDEAIAEGEALAEVLRAGGPAGDAPRTDRREDDGSAARETRIALAEARRAAAAAERRASAAEAALGARSASGHGGGDPSPGQVAELRAGAAAGAAGPAALGEAVVGLARARRSGGHPAVRAALWDVARTAVAWRERI